MATTLKDFVAERPVDRGRVEEHKERMPSEVRARIPHQQRLLSLLNVS